VANDICLVTGATGALGPPIVRAMLAADWRCRTFSRHDPPPGAAAAGVTHTSGDITDRAALAQAMNGVAVVVHLAALLDAADTPAASVPGYRRVNVDGTIAVFEAARACGVKRIIFASSIAVYGSSGTGILDEESPTEPETPYARSKRDAELELRRGASEGGPAVVILRIAAAYGPAIKGNYDRLVQAIARRRFVPVGSGRNRRTLVYEDDLARAVVLAAAHPAACGSTFNVTSGIYKLSEITAAIYTALGRRPPRLRIPLPFARVAAAGVESAAAVAGRRPPITRAALDKYTEDVAVSGGRIREALGFEPRVGLAAGWRQTVAPITGNRS
jgi:UDP-glucose 4-epimerase